MEIGVYPGLTDGLFRSAKKEFSLKANPALLIISGNWLNDSDSIPVEHDAAELLVRQDSFDAGVLHGAVRDAQHLPDVRFTYFVDKPLL